MITLPPATVHAQLRDMLKCTEEGSFYSDKKTTQDHIKLAKLEDKLVCSLVLAKSGKVMLKLTLQFIGKSLNGLRIRYNLKPCERRSRRWQIVVIYRRKR